jgi:3-hydroxy acid dehydrogenase / malonic semialdehyde reductase
MNRIENRTVLITGATSGIGEACARRLAAEGAHLVLWARRIDRLGALADELEAQHGRHVHVAQIDVRDRAAVEDAARALVEADALPHALINNAGLASGFEPLQHGDPDDWDVMIDTNIKGLLYVTRALLSAMIEKGRGHIVNIGSTAGHMTYPKGNVYAATKAAVRSLTDGINLDAFGTPVRVSSIDPGLVETEFSVVRFHGDESRAQKVYEGMQPLTGDDVADAVAYVLNLPEHVNVFDLVLMPTAQRNVYLVDRK